MISDEQRKRIADLAFRAFDSLADEPDDADITDAVLIYEVQYADGHTAGEWQATSSRASVNAGLLSLAANAIAAPERDDEV